MKLKTRGKTAGLLVMLVALATFGQVWEESGKVLVGKRYGIGNATNVSASITPPGGGGFYNTNETVRLYVFAWKVIGTTTWTNNTGSFGTNVVYSAAAATNLSLATSNSGQFMVDWSWTPVPGAAGYVLFASIDNSAATNWAAVSSYSFGTNGFRYHDENSLWNWGGRANPPLPASPVFWGISIQDGQIVIQSASDPTYAAALVVRDALGQKLMAAGPSDVYVQGALRGASSVIHSNWPPAGTNLLNGDVVLGSSNGVLHAICVDAAGSFTTNRLAPP